MTHVLLTSRTTRFSVIALPSLSNRSNKSPPVQCSMTMYICLLSWNAPMKAVTCGTLQPWRSPLVRNHHKTYRMVNMLNDCHREANTCSEMHKNTYGGLPSHVVVCLHTPCCIHMPCMSGSAVWYTCTSRWLQRIVCCCSTAFHRL